ncbi:MAG: AI-2E family transporter [Dehalococcoidia bacterium]
MPPSNSGYFRLAWLAGTLIVAFVVMYSLRSAMFPFVIGGVIAYMLHPFVIFLENRFPWYTEHQKIRRIIFVVIVYSVSVSLLAGIIAIILPTSISQGREFISSIPEITQTARNVIENINRSYSESIPEEIRMQVDTFLKGVNSTLVDSMNTFGERSINFVTGTLSLVIGLAIVPVFIFYILKDSNILVNGIAAFFPPETRQHAINTLKIINHTFSSYIKAQLFLGLIVGLSVWLGLTIMGIKLSLWLGFIAGLCELIPIIGPWLGAIPGILVVLASDNPEKVIWAGLLYLVIQLIENSLLVNKIHGRALNLHPLAIMIVLVIGSQTAGLWGVVFGPPLLGAAVEVYRYYTFSWDTENTNDSNSIGRLLASKSKEDA